MADLSDRMSWEEKLQAIHAICPDAHLRMRGPGNWYVSAPNREVHEGGCLAGAYGNGATPQEAVEDDWRQMLAANPNNGKWIVIGAFLPTRRAYYWNGVTWAQSNETP